MGVDSKKLEPGCMLIDASVTAFSGLGLEDSHIQTFRLLLYTLRYYTIL